MLTGGCSGFSPRPWLLACLHLLIHLRVGEEEGLSFLHPVL